MSNFINDILYRQKSRNKRRPHDQLERILALKGVARHLRPLTEQRPLVWRKFTRFLINEHSADLSNPSIYQSDVSISDTTVGIAESYSITLVGGG